MAVPASCWLGLVVVLSVSTFGLRICVLFLLCSFSFTVGFVVMLCMQHSFTVPVTCRDVNSGVENSLVGIFKIVQLVLNPPKQSKCDQRLTGSTVIDEPLQEVLNYAMRDYVLPWYDDISPNEEFLHNCKDTVKKVINVIAFRAKDLKWDLFLTRKLVDNFASHVRLYKQARLKLQKQKSDSNSQPEFLSFFFDMENAMERNLCRKQVCISVEHEKRYLQNLVDIIMYLLLPPEDFRVKLLRYSVREVIVNMIFLPVIALVTDPDYVNRTIVKWFKEALITSKEFLAVIRCANSEEELNAVEEIIIHEMKVQNSKDTGDKDKRKKHIRSLSFVQEIVSARLSFLHSSSVDEVDSCLPLDATWKLQRETDLPLYILPFDVILTDNISLHYFTEFMTSVEAHSLVYFYHTVQGFRVTAEQLLSEADSNNDSSTVVEKVREAALQIYELYFSDKASLKVNIDETISKELLARITVEKPSESWFDKVQSKVYSLMQEDKYYPAFKKSSEYIRLLAELELLHDIENKSQGEEAPSEEDKSSDSLSLDSVENEDVVMEFPISEGFHQIGEESFHLQSCVEENFESDVIIADVYNTGITHHAGKSFAVYAIAVNHQKSDGPETRWIVVRRYSEFLDFHLTAVEKFPQLANLHFPGKKTFNNLSRKLMEKRRHHLNMYLQCLLKTEMLESCHGLQAMLLSFLEPGLYERGKRPLIRTMDSLVTPIKASVQSVGNKVKKIPDVLIDGLSKSVFRILGNSSNPSLNLPPPDTDKVASSLEEEGDDIPLHIMLLLMDEVFDLKNKDQWFRSRIIAILRQVIKTTFGDTINRRIIEHVEWMTSAHQVAEYVKLFRQAMWPNGILALPDIERDHKIKFRTCVAAKMLMLSSVPDELKHVIGSETTKNGVICIFEMFQNKTLNKRLIYTLVESFLEVLFPDNHLNELFCKLHSPASLSTPKSNVSQDKSKPHFKLRCKR